MFSVAATKKKSVDRELNRRMRSLLRDIRDVNFAGKQGDTARGLGFSGGFLSDILNDKRGVGMDVISSAAKFRPIEVLRAIGIDPIAVALLVSEDSKGADVGLEGMPEEVRRAARAAIELLGCTADEVLMATRNAVLEFGDRSDDRDPEWWFGKIRDRVPRRQKSGLRKKSKR